MRPNFIILALLAMAFSGCGVRPGAEALLETKAAAHGNKLVTVLSATDRGLEDPRKATYGSSRGSLRYEELTISVPPSHKPGAVEWLGGASNTDRSFAVIRRRQLPEAAFTELAATHAKAKGSLGVFVHGYNYTLAEAVFRLAQLGADNEAFPVSVLFSWPSKGTVTGYLADRDAATYARDDLVHVLDLLSNVKTEEKISLVAHSMGGWLVMEALRQLRLEGRSNVIDRFRVGLAAPDIDIDVFRSQMVSIGQLTPPLHLLVSTDDRALAASQRLAGGRLRVGSVDVRDPNLQEIAQREGITIIDVSSLKARDLAKHDRFVQFAAVGTVWPPDRMKATDQLGRSGVFVFRKSTVAASRRQ